MKIKTKAKIIVTFLKLALVAFLLLPLSLVGCEEKEGENVSKNLTGDITITPNINVEINTELTANYNGNETVSYQWKNNDLILNGETGTRYTPSIGGMYTVTVSSSGYISKTSEPVVISHIFDGFYNYPTGRADVTGTLTINNAINSEVLLFHERVDKENYIGTINDMGTVRIKMLEQNFYSIIAVQKLNYIEQKEQASQSHEIVYYSNTKAYTLAVSPSSIWGGAIWRFNNLTKYWVEVRKSDLTENYAVIQPDAKTVNVPIQIDEIYEYTLFFSREIKYNDMILAKVETITPMNMGLFSMSSSYLTHVTDIAADGLISDTKPFILVINNSSEPVRVFFNNLQKTNGSPSGDFVVNSGQRAFFSGFEPGDYLTNINFRSINWGQDNRYVPESQNMVMLKNMLYEITIPSGATPASSDIRAAGTSATPYFGWCKK